MWGPGNPTPNLSCAEHFPNTTWLADDGKQVPGQQRCHPGSIECMGKVWRTLARASTLNVPWRGISRFERESSVAKMGLDAVYIFNPYTPQAIFALLVWKCQDTICAKTIPKPSVFLVIIVNHIHLFRWKDVAAIASLGRKVSLKDLSASRSPVKWLYKSADF